LTRFEALGDQVAALLQVDEAIIDGEVVVIDETGRPQFYDLLRRAKAPAYVAFHVEAFGRRPRCPWVGS
jgi:ATP-dependent DNA ligase